MKFYVIDYTKNGVEPQKIKELAKKQDWVKYENYLITPVGITSTGDKFVYAFDKDESFNGFIKVIKGKIERVEKEENEKI